MDGWKRFSRRRDEKRAREFLVLDGIYKNGTKGGKILTRCFGAMNLLNDMPLISSNLLLFLHARVEAEADGRRERSTIGVACVCAPANRPSVAGLDFCIFHGLVQVRTVLTFFSDVNLRRRIRR